MRDLAQQLLEDESVAYLDVETTGLRHQDEVVFTAVLDTTGEILFASPIRPTYASLSREASRMNGITEEMIATAPTMADASPALVAALVGRRLVAYNADFDRRMITKSAHVGEAEGLLSVLPVLEWVDIMQPYARLRGNWSPRFKTYKYQSLQNALEQQGVVPAQHTYKAVADCLDMIALLRAVAGATHAIRE